MGVLTFLERLAERGGSAEHDAASTASRFIQNEQCAEHLGGFVAKYEGARAVAKKFGLL